MAKRNLSLTRLIKMDKYCNNTKPILRIWDSKELPNEWVEYPTPPEVYHNGNEDKALLRDKKEAERGAKLYQKGQEDHFLSTPTL